MAKGRKHLTVDEKRAIIRAYKGGEKYAAIATHWSICDSTLQRLLIKEGVPMRGPGYRRASSGTSHP